MLELWLTIGYCRQTTMLGKSTRLSKQRRFRIRICPRKARDAGSKDMATVRLANAPGGDATIGK
jgi:hypothetical protein